jgi:hypothetical protein
VIRIQYILVTAVLALAGTVTIDAQNTPNNRRLTRAAVHDANGKLFADATIGNLTVDAIGDANRAVQASKDPRTAAVLADFIYCKANGTSRILAMSVKELLKKTNKADKELLRAGDPTAIRTLSIGAIAFLENINPQSIADDEAIGPGVYHDSIAGLEQALQVCDFYGHLR